ncbi:hypothetical protein MACH17_32370 [Phaeobacter inhibens]|nr:hypothetical protein MACH17_32370 [Phaeobacter inhibens]
MLCVKGLTSRATWWFWAYPLPTPPDAGTVSALQSRVVRPRKRHISIGQRHAPAANDNVG